MGRKRTVAEVLAIKGCGAIDRVLLAFSVSAECGSAIPLVDQREGLPKRRDVGRFFLC